MAVGNNDNPIIIFLDLQTEFDSVDHNILFVKSIVWDYRSCFRMVQKLLK